MSEINPPAGSEIVEDSPNPASEGNDTGEAPNGNREAAKYRVRAKEAEAARDQLAQRVDSLLSREAERVASHHLAEPADLFTLSGKTIGDFIDPDTGELDEELITQTANELLGTRPGLAKNAPAVDPTQGHGLAVGKTAPSFADFLKF